MTLPIVHLVDDEPPVRDALTFLLHTHGLPSRAYASGPELLQALDAAPQRGCIVLDVRMERMSGLQVHDVLIARRVALPVLFLSGHGDIPMAVEAVRKGALDFLEKPFSDDALVARIRHALAIEQSRFDAAAAHAREAALFESLTDREREVMLRVAAGKLNKVIADELDIAMRTVEVHRSRVFAKLGVRSAAEVASLLARHGNDASAQ